ncbi:MAG: hypothetical protein COX65_08415, partial [Elusimicrobia bacterium CG_4_10_14_0_2_um_filter_56_8]
LAGIEGSYASGFSLIGVGTKPHQALIRFKAAALQPAAAPAPFRGPENCWFLAVSIKRRPMPPSSLWLATLVPATASLAHGQGVFAQNSGCGKLLIKHYGFYTARPS